MPPPFSRLHSQFSPGNRFGATLQSYFRSGWAFLIPYLAAYLLYAWLKWPVNSAASGEGIAQAASGSEVSGLGSGESSLLPAPCSLLHLYWILHAIHLILCAIALRFWWRGFALQLQLLTSTGALGTAVTYSLPATRYSLLWPLASWAFLALLFWIPGVYLEFPADPWQHYGRVNEWSWLQTVMEHSAWKKSSYFLAYSFIGQVSPPAFQLKWFDVYYTGCCLLLCWQYYRLARAVGLGSRASFVFVLLNTLTFGNNIFGFYRYYGMSSTVFAQLGAIALTRMVMEAAKDSYAQNDRQNLIRRIILLLAPCSLLLAFTAFNHVQGLGIAGLGIAAVLVWRLIEWRRSMIAWLTLTAVALSIATILWYPRHPTLDQLYQPQGWLTSWYGFNLFDPNSMAFSHGISLLGASGTLSFIGGILLLRRNDVVGWLSIMPIIALASPWCAIPLTNMIASGEHGPEYISTFSRLFLSIPSGLSIIALINIAKHKANTRQGIDVDISDFTKTTFPIRQTGLVAGILLMVLLIVFDPPNFPFHNRFWHAMAAPPQDLEMRHVISAESLQWADPSYRTSLPAVVAHQGIRFVLESTVGRDLSRESRIMGAKGALTPAATSMRLIQSLLEPKSGSQRDIVMLPSAAYIFTPFSAAGFLSQHWLPQQLSLEHSAVPEISAALQLENTKYSKDTATGNPAPLTRPLHP